MSDDLDAIRQRVKDPLHEALHTLGARIPNLAGDCHCNLLAEVSLDVLVPALHAQLSDAHHEGFGAGVQWSDQDRDEALAAAHAAGYAEAVARLRDDDAFGTWLFPAVVPHRDDWRTNRLAADYLEEATKETTDHA